MRPDTRTGRHCCKPGVWCHLLCVSFLLRWQGTRRVLCCVVRAGHLHGLSACLVRWQRLKLFRPRQVGKGGTAASSVARAPLTPAVPAVPAVPRHLWRVRRVKGALSFPSALPELAAGKTSPRILLKCRLRGPPAPVLMQDTGSAFRIAGSRPASQTGLEVLGQIPPQRRLQGAEPRNLPLPPPVLSEPGRAAGAGWSRGCLQTPGLIVRPGMRPRPRGGLVLCPCETESAGRPAFPAGRAGLAGGSGPRPQPPGGLCCSQASSPAPFSCPFSWNGRWLVPALPRLRPPSQ